MKVKDLLEQLKQMNPNAEVMIMTEEDNDKGYQTVFDCEEEYSDLVTIGCGYPIVTKEQLQKAIKDNDKELLSQFEADDIGQGYGYKTDKSWDKVLPNEVIYIPECGYNTEYGNGCGYPLDVDCIYTKQDFINIVKERVKPSRVDEEASALFDMVDWQCPETLAEELDFDEDYEEEQSDRAFVPEINCRGCKSKCVDKKTGKPACEEVDDLCENITWCPKTCGKN